MAALDGHDSVVDLFWGDTFIAAAVFNLWVPFDLPKNYLDFMVDEECKEYGITGYFVGEKVVEIGP